MTQALRLDAAEVAKLAKGDHKALIKATLPGGAYSAEPCMMRCAMCKKPCIDEKYM